MRNPSLHLLICALALSACSDDGLTPGETEAGGTDVTDTMPTSSASGSGDTSGETNATTATTDPTSAGTGSSDTADPSDTADTASTSGAGSTGAGSETDTSTGTGTETDTGGVEFPCIDYDAQPACEADEQCTWTAGDICIPTDLAEACGQLSMAECNQIVHCSWSADDRMCLPPRG